MDSIIYQLSLDANKKNIKCSKLCKNKKKGLPKKKKLVSLKAIGHILDAQLICDKRGHPYIWDPRYKKRKMKDDIRDQQDLNSNLLKEPSRKKGKNLIFIQGKFHSFILLLYVISLICVLRYLLYILCFKFVLKFCFRKKIKSSAYIKTLRRSLVRFIHMGDSS